MKRNIALFFSVIAASFVAVQPVLAKEQQPVPTLVLISNVNIFDGVNENLIENANVLIERNLIAAVSTDPIKAKGATPHAFS